ncbi:DUF4407 domain-containing protein [Tsukamurella sp. 8F]|uniref:DUF4407 domain-containing protein n=1 Tax=unclassified Tsukamurella TaxID=2633480 RepID=UPI0023B8A439|nr:MULTISPECIES: DUF4407 domain-containing protein [unclassified Tsukamurella]MDF0531325.1 DUF4407 domain-containing protein [Tsukamurella sp. 8J]MDF0588531.1 DUF4407 domain-containing protein [Tsukamurella sp. 8F]
MTHRTPEPRGITPMTATAVWLGGGRPTEAAERDDRATYATAGVVVAVLVLVAAMACGLALAADGAVVAGVLGAVAAGAIVFAVSRALLQGRVRDAFAARVAVAALIGLLIGECAALVLLGGRIGPEVTQRAYAQAASAPAVTDANAALADARSDRAALDAAVDKATAARDRALVVARCEFRPTATCPQTRITGVPGQGPETRTADAELARVQAELDAAVAARTQQSAGLDQRVERRADAASTARRSAVDSADRGIGIRWLALGRVTKRDGSALLLRIAVDLAGVALAVLPLAVRRWRGTTRQDHAASVRAAAGAAEARADTDIAVRAAQARSEVDAVWTEQRLAENRMAADAETAVARSGIERGLAQAGIGRDSDPPTVQFAPVESVRLTTRRSVRGVPPSSPLPPRSTLPPAGDDDGFLPIALAAEAASLGAEVPSAVGRHRGSRPAAVAEPAEPAADQESSGGALPAVHEPAPDDDGKLIPFLPAVPVLDDVNRAAGRWVRPFVPSLVTNAFDAGTRPLRTVRHAFEEVEEVTFSMRRVRRVTVESSAPATEDATPGRDWVEGSVAPDADRAAVDAGAGRGLEGAARQGIDASGRRALGPSRD